MRLIITLIISFSIIFSSCKESVIENDLNFTDKADDIGNKINVAILYGSSSYFLYKNKPMGYEYELVKSFAKTYDKEVRFIIAYNIDELKTIMSNKEADIIAYPLKFDTDINQYGYSPCGIKRITHQVLVQPKNKQITRINNVTQLKGKEIYVEQNSRYYQRLNNLNNEIGGGIIVNTLDNDTIPSTEELIRKVANGEIPYTLADHNLASVNCTFFNNIDASLKVSCEQYSSWMINSNDSILYSMINKWSENESLTPEYAPITKRYYEKSKDSNVAIKYLLLGKKLSVYDEYYIKYSKSLEWDWRLLAALSFEESRFDPSVKSNAGARGLLQLMPHTGYRFGLTEKTFLDPEQNIKAGTKYLKSLKNIFSSVEDSNEQYKFILASFHAGIGHIIDARNIARKYGYNPDIWDNNVADCLLMKNDSAFYLDSTIVKCGYFDGITTLSHVNNIKARYLEFIDKTE